MFKDHAVLQELAGHQKKLTDAFLADMLVCAPVLRPMEILCSRDLDGDAMGDAMPMTVYPSGLYLMCASGHARIPCVSASGWNYAMMSAPRQPFQLGLHVQGCGLHLILTGGHRKQGAT